jgi:hypothetical protein
MEISRANQLKIKIIAIAGLMVVLIGLKDAFSQGDNIYRMHSLFLYNFTKHVKWEEGQASQFVIGIFDNREAYQEIKSNLESKKVWGKDIKIIEISSANDMSSCHIAFMPKSNKKKVVEMISAASLENTLLVTEDDLVDDGAAISFVFQQSRMNFKISKEKIEQSGLKVSNSLISIGIPV